MSQNINRLVDEGSLQDYLERQLGSTDHFSVNYAEGGIANETVFVDWGERELVLRRPPAEDTAASGHEVLRDHSVFEALGGTDIPVPEPVLRCEDASVIESEFYIAERVHGVVPHPDEPAAFADPETRQIVGETAIDTLTKIHQVDYDAIGLSEFGYPNGFTERQVGQWKQQLNWAISVTNSERTLDGVEELHDWLQANIPREVPDPALIHGDFGLHNLMFDPEQPSKIVSVFDWELSTIGNPLMDLGWTLMFWPDQGDPEVQAPELISSYLKREGYPTRTELIDRYEQETGIEFENARFYRVFGAFKLIGVGEMLFARHLKRNGDTPPLFRWMEEIVPSYVERAEAIIGADDPLEA